MNLTVLFREIEKSFPQLEKLLTDEELSEFKNMPGPDLCLYHFGLGDWIRNNLLTQGSRLLELFTQNSITHKDDMSFMVIRLLHQKISGTMNESLFGGSA